MHEQPGHRAPPTLLFEASQQVTRAALAFRSDPEVLEVLKAFNIEVLIDERFPIRLSSLAIEFGGIKEGPPPPSVAGKVLESLWTNWRKLEDVLQLLAKVLGSHASADADATLSLEMRYPDGQFPKLKR